MTHVIINTNNAPSPCGPYVQAIRSGNIIFISGQLPICPKTGHIPHDIYNQTQQTLQNIKNIIEKTNLKINNIIKMTLFIIDINDLSVINTSYTDFFNTHSFSHGITNFPTRSCIAVSKLPKDSKIEIEAIAISDK